MANSRKRHSTDFIERFAAHVAPLLPACSSVLIGLSGGVDSVVLLHLLYNLTPRFSWKLSALHVHHGISQNADAWASFCSDLCNHYFVPLHVEYVDVASLRAHHGLEAAARKLRYAAFAKQSCDFVALAHHADDQAETLLLQLLRGAGTRGASAMPLLAACEKPFPDLVRPLLPYSRQEVIEYAMAHELRWVDDESNTDNSYPRNFLRHRVMPLLNEKFPAYRSTLARSAEHFAEASKLLDDLAQIDAPDLFADRVRLNDNDSIFIQSNQLNDLMMQKKKCLKDQYATLEVSYLQSLSHLRAKNLLRYFLHGIGAPTPQAAQLDVMLQQLCHARQDANVCIRYCCDNWEVRRYQGKIYVLPKLGDFDRNLIMTWKGEAELDWPPLNVRLHFNSASVSGISLKKIQHGSLTLRLRHGGETICPHPKSATRTLKNLLQEQHVPPWQRDRLPLLYCDEELVSVPGLVIAEKYQTTKEESLIILIAETPTLITPDIA